MRVVKISLFILITGIMFMGCSKKVIKVLPKGTGDWNIVSFRYILYLNDVIFDDVTDTTNAGKFHFNKDLSGDSRIDTTFENFTWLYNETAEQIQTISGTETVTYDILECTRKTLTLYTTDSLDVFGTETRWQSTYKMEKL